MAKLDLITFLWVFVSTFLCVWAVGLLVLAVLSEGAKQRYLFYVMAFLVFYCAVLSIRASY